LFTNRVVSTIKYADVTAHKGLPHTLLEALDGIGAANRSFSAPRTASLSVWAYLANRGIPLAFGNPSVVAHRIAHLYRLGQDKAAKRTIDVGHERAGSGWR